MSMKKIISSLKKKGPESDSRSDTSSLKSAASNSKKSGNASHTSTHTKPLQFHQHSDFPRLPNNNFSEYSTLMEDDADSIAPSSLAQSFQTSYKSNSVFSKGRTIGTTSTRQSSVQSSVGQKDGFQQFTSIGRPLRVLNEEDSEENEEPEQRPIPDSLDSGSVSAINIKRQASNITEEAASSPVSLQFGFPSSVTSQSVVGEPSMGFDNSVASSPIKRVTSSLSAYSGGVDAPVMELVQILEYVEKQLRFLSLNMSNTLLQVSQSVLNLTKAAVAVTETIKKAIAAFSTKTQMNKMMARLLQPGHLTTATSPSLRRIVKNALFIVDHLLVGDVYQRSQAMIMSSLYELFAKLKLVDHVSIVENYSVLMQPTLFPLGSNHLPFPNEGQTAQIMESLVTKFTNENEDNDVMLSDQEGSFIAPVLRGFQTPDLSVITFVFGFPELTKDHADVVKIFSNSVENFHFTCQKNMIKVASTAVAHPPAQQHQPVQQSAMYTFKAPFRNAMNQMAPPISMSLASDNAMTLSGTLGGYLYPKIPKNTKNQKLLKYANNVFAITCAHVALNSDMTYRSPSEYPHISVPSPVLVNLYKRALINERSKYNSYSEEFKAYNGVVHQIDTIFPERNVKVQMSQQNEDGKRSVVEKEVKRNLPSESFGQIIWGERIIHEAKSMLSDIAMIKVNNKMKCLNFLGDDVNFSEYDPSLMFSNLYVKELVDLSAFGKRVPTASGSVGGAGLEVFKYGSTTKYTRGNINGVKMVYWSEGKLHSSEFVVKASNYSLNGGNGTRNPAGTAGLGFAAGGDSGAWLLAKLSDVESYSERQQQQQQQQAKTKSSFLNTIFEQFQESLNSGTLNVLSNSAGSETSAQKVPKTGLGVVGMLHSYDGEYKQFGLFTPMTSILDRLSEVTNIDWGIVGVDDSADGVDETVNSDNESGYETETSMDDTYAKDGAMPPL